MERVQFQQEQMLAELKDLHEKGLFTQSEIRHIMKKRTHFETMLVRRIPKKADFLRYAAYEMSLEELRKKRMQRIKVPKGPPTVSDFAILRRQYQILERALRKFKDDLSLWLTYIRLASSSGSRALVGRLCGRAITLHPTCPMLYILGANHELRYGGYSAARALLQRGLRMNAESSDLWREMVRLELGFIDVVRKRWEVLGLVTGLDYDGEEFNRVSGNVETQESSPEQAAGELEDDDEKARKAILSGAVVETVISNAVKENFSIELFKSIHNTLTSPDTSCPPAVRRSLISFLHTHLQSYYLSPSSSLRRSAPHGKGKQNSESQAALLYATRFLTPDLQGESFVDALQAANEDLIEAYRGALALAQSTPKVDLEGIGDAYAQFVSEWFEKDGIDENLKLYLIASLQSLCNLSTEEPSPPASILTTHLKLISSPFHPHPPSPTKVLKLARRYTTRLTHSPDLWLFRISVEEKHGNEHVWRASWEEARKVFLNYSGIDEEKRLLIWTYGLDKIESSPISEQIKINEFLIKESILAEHSPSDRNELSDVLLIRYIKLLYARSLSVLSSCDTLQTKKRKDDRRNVMATDMQHVAQLYLPSARVWDAAFDVYSGARTSESECSSPEDWRSKVVQMDDTDLYVEERTSVLRFIYNRWRLFNPVDHSKAALKWGAWLLLIQRRLREVEGEDGMKSKEAAEESGKEAAHAIANARTGLKGNDRAQFEKDWRSFVDNLEGSIDEGTSEEDDDIIMVS